jgi:hypothetical protein
MPKHTIGTIDTATVEIEFDKYKRVLIISGTKSRIHLVEMHQMQVRSSTGQTTKGGFLGFGGEKTYKNVTLDILDLPAFVIVGVNSITMIVYARNEGVFIIPPEQAP